MIQEGDMVNVQSGALAGNTGRVVLVAKDKAAVEVSIDGRYSAQHWIDLSCLRKVVG